MKGLVRQKSPPQWPATTTALVAFLALLWLPSAVYGFINNNNNNMNNIPPSSRPQIRQFSPTSLSAVPEIEKWRILNNGSVQGTVKKHPSIPDGDIITTSPLKAPNAVGRRMTVVTGSGSKYKLLDPLETPGQQKKTKGGTVTVNKPFSMARKLPSIQLSALPKNVPILDDWKLLDNDSVQGSVFNHPTIPDGQIVNTSTLQNPKQAAQTRVVTTVTGSKYKLGVKEMNGAEKAAPSANDTGGSSSSSSSSSIGGGFGLFNLGGTSTEEKDAPTAAETATSSSASDGALSPRELRNKRVQAQRDYGLTGESIGTDTKYLLAGSPIKSTSGKSLIFRAYTSDDNGLPVGDVEKDAITIKLSSNNVAIEREAGNYRAISKGGMTRGKFVSLLEYLNADEMNSSSGRSTKQCALVMERGVEDLKTYLSRSRDAGGLSGKELRDAAAAAAQCVQAAHQSGLVWTDLKTENFVVTRTGDFKGIDLESAIPVGGNPVDYSPEACPPEFAQAFLDGDGPYFSLQTSYDIWSLGMMFYELGSGRGYFDGKTPIQITRELAQMKNMEVDADIEMDGRFRSLVKSCLQVNPNKRPAVAQILLHPYFITTGFGPFSF
jgi:hypothetical protein